MSWAWKQRQFIKLFIRDGSLWGVVCCLTSEASIMRCQDRGSYGHSSHEHWDKPPNVDLFVLPLLENHVWALLKRGSMPDGSLSLVWRVQWSCPFFWRVWKDTSRYWGCYEACYLRCRWELLSQPFSTGKVSWRCKHKNQQESTELIRKGGQMPLCWGSTATHFLRSLITQNSLSPI